MGSAVSSRILYKCHKSKSQNGSDSKKNSKIQPEVWKDEPAARSTSQTFTFSELADATQNFQPECLLSESGTGRVYKGRLASTGQETEVKQQIDRDGLGGKREFLTEVLMLSLLHHPNLINLIGYCADGNHRLLVFEHLPLGSLEDQLHELPEKEPLDWNTRMKIAEGVAKGLEYLHNKASPPVIHRDLKPSNILLDQGYHPKLSGFGIAKLGPVGDETRVIRTSVKGTDGYCDPEYVSTGQLSLKSDVYSFGVVFLEIITGRKAIDSTRGPGEADLVEWARPLLDDGQKLLEMVDPHLLGCYPMRGLQQALAVASMCLKVKAASRPPIGDVMAVLTDLASQTYDPNALSISNQ